MSSEGVVILNLGCGYIENGVVISVCHRNPSASLNCSYRPSSLSTIKPINHQAYRPSSLSPIEPINLWSSLATFKPFGLFNVERGPWFTLAEMTIHKYATVKAMKYSKGKIYLVTSPDNNNVGAHEYVDVHEYDVQSGCWNTDSKKINCLNWDFHGDYKAEVDSSDDVDNIYFQLDLISTIVKNDSRSPGLIYHAGKYYLGGECINANDKEWIHLLYTYSFWSSVEVFDLLTKKFKPMPAMRVSRDHARMESLGKYLYVIGGQSDDEGPILKSVEAYDPEANTWFNVADMNEPRKDCLSVTYNGLLFVFGGFEGRNYFNSHQKFKSSFECYDPNTNKWTVLEPLYIKNFKSSLVDLDIVADDGWIIVRENLVIGRRDFAKFYRYNIGEGKWKSEEQVIKDRTMINFCVVKKEVILPYTADVQGERELLVKRYFAQLSQQ